MFEVMRGEVFMLVVSVFFAVFQQLGLIELQNMHRLLEAEKSSMESILTKVCDVLVWVAADGETILRKDARFGNLVGTKIISDNFLAFFQGGESARVSGAFAKMLASETTAASPPLLVHTAMRVGDSDDNPVDLLIVDRRKIFEHVEPDPSKRCGFLIGIRSLSTIEWCGSEQSGSANSGAGVSTGIECEQQSKSHSVTSRSESLGAPVELVRVRDTDVEQGCPRCMASPNKWEPSAASYADATPLRSFPSEFPPGHCPSYPPFKNASHVVDHKGPLHQWEPGQVQNSLLNISQARTTICQASDRLVWIQRARAREAVHNYLLAGIRLDTLFPGLSPGPWRRIVALATGAFPVKLCAIEKPPHCPEIEQCVWVVPHFSSIADDDQLPLCWEFSPQVAYDRIFNKAVARAEPVARHRR